MWDRLIIYNFCIRACITFIQKVCNKDKPDKFTRNYKRKIVIKLLRVQKYMARQNLQIEYSYTTLLH